MRTHHTFPSLDGFRGVTALCVVLHHTKAYWGIEVPRSAITVDLFFLLGGFVVAHAYEQRLRTGQISIADFALIRLIRLYPLYALSVLLMGVPMLVALLVHHNRPVYITLQYLQATLLNILMLPAHLSDSPTLLYPLNIAFWSLLFVLITNFCYACLNRRLTNRVLSIVAVVSAIVLTTVVWMSGTIGIGQLWGGLSLAGGMARAVFGMSMGVLLFRHYRSVPKWMTGEGALLPLAIIMVLVWTPSIGKEDWLLQLFTVLIVFPWCVIRAAGGDQSKSNRYLQALGALSYPIYVLHLPVAHFLDVLSFHRLGQYAPFSGMVILVAVVLVALVADRKFDRPVRDWLSAKWFGRRTVQVAIQR